MDFLWYLLISIVSGILAGMGMGGGTLLIPALTIIMGVSQDVAQSVNLLAFVPCAVVCIIIYSKNKLVNYKIGGIIVAGSIILAIVSALIAIKIESKILKIIFGVFIAGLGIVQFVCFLIKKLKEKNQKNKNNFGNI